MIRRPPRATRTDTLVPYPTLFRSASLVRKHYEGDGADGERTVVGRIHDGEVALVVNTPHGTTSGGSPRLDGYEIRAAAIMTDIPCITPIPGLGPARSEERRVGKARVRTGRSRWSRSH